MPYDPLHVLLDLSVALLDPFKLFLASLNMVMDLSTYEGGVCVRSTCIRRKSIARDHVEPGNVTAQSAAIQIIQCQYICNAMNGINIPLAIRNMRAVRSNPLPVNTQAAKRVAKLMKLYPKISTAYRNESKTTN